MGQEPQTSPKKYVSDLFEKSLHVLVTYQSKILSKTHFPEGGGLLGPPKLIGLRLFDPWHHLVSFQIIVAQLNCVYKQYFC